jgi:murein DD-endopeptidase MepM/ murein hydrolase activator NlpD
VVPALSSGVTTNLIAVTALVSAVVALVPICEAETKLPTETLRRPSPITVSIPEAFVYPVLGPRLSSDYGIRKHPIRKTRRHHHGVDLAAPVGAAIRSIAAGQVIFADPFGGYGKFVVIRHAGEMTSHYGHCDSILVNPGDVVRAGQIIGKVGNSGRSTGPHLHLEIRRGGIPQDPEKVLPGLADPAQG